MVSQLENGFNLSEVSVLWTALITALSAIAPNMHNTLCLLRNAAECHCVPRGAMACAPEAVLRALITNECKFIISPYSHAINYSVSVVDVLYILIVTPSNHKTQAN